MADEPRLITVSSLLEGYAQALKGYQDAQDAFIAEPTPRNMVLMHRQLDAVFILRDETSRSQKISAAIEPVDPWIQDLVDNLTAQARVECEESKSASAVVKGPDLLDPTEGGSTPPTPPDSEPPSPIYEGPTEAPPGSVF